MSLPPKAHRKRSRRKVNVSSLTRVYNGLREVILQEFPRAVTVKEFLSSQAEREGRERTAVWMGLQRGEYPVFTIVLNPRVVYVVPKEDCERR